MFPASPSYVTQRLVASDLGQTTREGGSERLGQGEATRAYILHKIASFKDTGLIFSIHCTGSSRMLTDSASLCSLHHLGCMTDEKSIQRCICFLFPGTWSFFVLHVVEAFIVCRLSCIFFLNLLCKLTATFIQQLHSLSSLLKWRLS